MLCCFSAHIICISSCLFFFNDTATTEIYTLSLHDALPICHWRKCRNRRPFPAAPCALRAESRAPARRYRRSWRSEEHTSELQSPCNLVCRLLLEKKKTHIPHLQARSYTIQKTYTIHIAYTS